MANLTAFLAQFPEIREERDGNALVPCPAHDDGRPSLLVSVSAEGKLLLYCRAGCETGKVLEALGMERGELFGWSGGSIAARTTQRSGLETRHIAALAHYVDRTAAKLMADGDGALTASSYARSRFGVDSEMEDRLRLGYDAGAEFPFEHLSSTFARFPRLTVPLIGFDGVTRGLQGRDITGQCTRRWVSISNPDGTSWAKYGVMRGGEPGGSWIVTEGPGDGLAAAAAGWNVAVVRGAALVRNQALVDELAEGMRGADVYVAGDADPAGQRFAADLARVLGARPLRLPDGVKDLGAWYEEEPQTFGEGLAEACREADEMHSREETTEVDAPVEIAPEWLEKLVPDSKNNIQTVDYARFVSEI